MRLYFTLVFFNFSITLVQYCALHMKKEQANYVHISNSVHETKT